MGRASYAEQIHFAHKACKFSVICEYIYRTEWTHFTPCASILDLDSLQHVYAVFSPGAFSGAGRSAFLLGIVGGLLRSLYLRTVSIVRAQLYAPSAHDDYTRKRRHLALS